MSVKSGSELSGESFGAVIKTRMKDSIFKLG